jgi:ADP-ribosylglycohydrolase
MSNTIPKGYLEKLYAGWLGKIIGVRHGANIEGWTYERIEKTFGELTTYPYDFKNFAADDDTNGPMFFVRALEDYTHTREITAEQMGLTALNYVADGHGFFWWGGYGKSTEHTAYTNLKSGIKAPRSGSIEQNGEAVAEQIGGQIFIDVWGFIAPGNPSLAAEYAEKMASVTHGGNGIYGGRFVAACVAEAFVENNIEKVIESGLSVIPSDCEYTRMARAVMDFYYKNPEDWRKAFHYVKENFGYHLYPGNCHIIPNSAVMILAMMYGQGDYSRTINICNMCGWDTDCNVGNVGAILGTMVGLDGIDKSWTEPINDFICASSVIGSLNISDIPAIVSFTGNLGYMVAGEEVPMHWKDILETKDRYFHFEYPGSTHVFRFKGERGSNSRILLSNTTEAAHSGERSLKITVPKANIGVENKIYYQTYYTPEDFNDSRYDPDFSPVLYPGQTVEAWVMAPEGQGVELAASLYVKDRNSGKLYYGERVTLTNAQWSKLTYHIPAMENSVILEAGVEFLPLKVSEGGWDFCYTTYLDDMRFTGKANYSIDFSKERMEKWHGLHETVSQTTYNRGIWTLEQGELSGSYAGEPAECYTGDYYWKDYSFEAVVLPKLGSNHNINFRVQGGIRSYAVGFAPEGKIALYKNCNGYSKLTEAGCPWKNGEAYNVKVQVVGNEYKVYVDSREVLSYRDESDPYLYGQIGFSNFGGSHTHYKGFKVVVL